jgi:hypothetical protein
VRFRIAIEPKLGVEQVAVGVEPVAEIDDDVKIVSKPKRK